MASPFRPFFSSPVLFSCTCLASAALVSLHSFHLSLSDHLFPLPLPAPCLNSQLQLGREHQGQHTCALGASLQSSRHLSFPLCLSFLCCHPADMIQRDGAAGENESPDSRPDHSGQENAWLEHCPEGAGPGCRRHGGSPWPYLGSPGYPLPLIPSLLRSQKLAC